MNILEISQLVFNIIASLTILVVGILIGVIALEVIMFIKATKKLAEDIKIQSARWYGKLDSFLLTITSLSFISKIFKKNKNGE